ncbi:MAG: 4a-hydroxytetrahydrobiopterin dehydratase [bacterium]
MARTPLTPDQVALALADLDGWEAVGASSIAKTFTLKDHLAALGFVVKVAAAAEVLDHHPTIEWTYNKLHFVLNTHDAGGVTKRDFELAAKIDELA